MLLKMRLFRIINLDKHTKTAVDFSETELEELNHEYTSLLASIISSFITRHKIQNIQAVCSHGHTILHQPIKGITSNWNLPILSDLLGQTVVCDFRSDVLLGGQGPSRSHRRPFYLLNMTIA
jgi:anhydro-N-acetylmuramic acid kinase